MNDKRKELDEFIQQVTPTSSAGSVSGEPGLPAARSSATLAEVQEVAKHLLPSPFTVCQDCMAAMWTYTPSGARGAKPSKGGSRRSLQVVQRPAELECYCRIKHQLSYNSDQPSSIKSCDGPLIFADEQ